MKLLEYNMWYRRIIEETTARIKKKKSWVGFGYDKQTELQYTVRLVRSLDT